MMRLRPQEPADYPAIAELFHRVNPPAPPASAEIIAHFTRNVDPGRPSAYVVAEEQDALLAFGVLAASPASQVMGLIIDVDEPYRRRGLGTGMLRWLTGRLDVSRRVQSFVSEESAAGVAFARHHGFEERFRVFPSVLDLTRFEPSAFAGQRRSAEEVGLTFTTFAAVDDAGMRHRLHELQNALMADVPRPDTFQPVNFQQWEASWLEAPFFRAELLALAMAGDRPVAMSCITVNPDGSAYNDFTGVAPDYRGRGLGLAIKVEALLLAKASGYGKVSTHNDTNNAPILAVNARLGYQRQPGEIGFERTLAPNHDTTSRAGAATDATD
jgi:GNAT superfamily N-acetyltransferase